ncbi:MAG: serine/threonine protein kinase [Vicinamibacteria bacterium]|nr:serine/threonine protein kinase [Vicinamibacteria bacterium]
MEQQKFGKYQVLGQLGEGAMGVVFKAQDPILNRFVAIKTISASLGTDSDLRQRFQREAQAAASLNHPNIITIHDFGEEAGKIYMAMELLEGKDLKDLIVEGAFRTYDDKLAVMEQICDGLAYAHAKKIVHRDLKPGNIHVQPNGQIKILDFGLARLGQSDMTKTGIVMGTPNYMSPEQVMGEKVDARSDVFSLGAVFYELLTAHKPFEADSVHAVLFQVVHKEPQPVRHWTPDVPTVLVQLVEKCLSKSAAERFPDAGALREALHGVRQALSAGQLESADLADMLEYELVSEGEVGPAPVADADGTQMLGETPVARPTGPSSRPPGPRTGSFPPVRSGSRPPASGPRPPVRTPPQPVAAPAPAPHSKAPMIAMGFVAVAAVAGVAWMALRPAPAPAPAADTQKMDALTAVLVQTQLDLAQRVLDDKDYAGATSQAERALSLDPANARAKQILQTAQKTLKDLDTAAAEARAAFDAGDTEKASAALGRVLAIDPKHPVAGELSGKLNRFFQSQADTARTAMARSRDQASSAGLGSRSEFQEAAGLASRAEGQFGKGEYAQATQGFLQARDSFDRVRRAAEKEAAEKAAADAKAAAERARVAATPAPTAPPVTAPPTTVAVAPPPTTVAPTPVPGRSFTPGKTTLTGVAVGKGGPAGFDTAGVTKPAEFVGQVLFEPSPDTVRPGEPFTVRVVMVNEGRKGVDLKSVSANAYAGGRRIPLTAALAVTELKPGQRAVVTEIQASLPENVPSWLLDVTITSDKGENYRSQLTLK